MSNGKICLISLGLYLNSGGSIYKSLAMYKGTDWKKYVSHYESTNKHIIDRRYNHQCGPNVIKTINFEKLRLKLLEWPLDCMSDYHNHPKFSLIGIRVLSGGPLIEKIKSYSVSPPISMTKNIKKGYVSVLSGKNMYHSIENEFNSSITLHAEIFNNE